MSTIGSIVTVGSVVVREPGEFKPLNINKREFAHLKTPDEIKITMGKVLRSEVERVETEPVIESE